MSYEDVIEEILEAVEEDKDCDRYTIRFDLSTILDKFIERNTWQLKAKIADLENELYKDRRGNL